MVLRHYIDILINSIQITILVDSLTVIESIYNLNKLSIKLFDHEKCMREQSSYTNNRRDTRSDNHQNMCVCVCEAV